MYAASLCSFPALLAAVAEISPVTLTIYSPGNENSVPTKTIIEYARLVSEASNGAITLDVHHSNELGNDAEAIESTRMGTIDLIFAGTSGFTAFYEPAKILDLPFLFDSAEEAYEVVNGEVGEQIFAGFGDYQLVYSPRAITACAIFLPPTSPSIPLRM